MKKDLFTSYIVRFSSLLMLLSIVIFLSAACGGKKSSTSETHVDRTANLNFIFNNSTIGDVTITISEAEWNTMLGYYDLNPRNETCVHADFKYAKDGSEWNMSDVGLRIRGNTSRRRVEGSYGELHNAQSPAAYHQAHFSVDFEQWLTGTAEAKMAGCMKGVILKWCKPDTTFVREMYGYDLFRRNGIWTAPRVSYTKLTIKIGADTAYYGVYEMIEETNKQFLKARTTSENGEFTNNDGNLWKCLWQGSADGPDLQKRLSYSIGIENINLNETLSQRVDFDLKTNKTALAAAQTELIAFIDGLDALNISDPAAMKIWFDSKMNVDLFLKTYAVNVILGMWDDYWANKNNYYLYFDTGGKVYFLPYDYDNILGVSHSAFGDAGTRNPLYWGDTAARPLINKILAVPEYKTIYKNYLTSMSNSSSDFDVTASKARIAAWHTLITPFIPNHTDGYQSISDTVASWGSTPDYRLWTGSDSVNFFMVKADSIAHMDDTIAVTIDPNGGTLPGGITVPTLYNLHYGAAITDLPSITYSGYVMTGWIIDDGGSTDVTALYDGILIKANWILKTTLESIMVYTVSGTDVTIRFDPAMFDWTDLYVCPINSEIDWYLSSYTAADITGVYIVGDFNLWTRPPWGSWNASKVEIAPVTPHVLYEKTAALSSLPASSGFKFIVIFNDADYIWIGPNRLNTHIPNMFKTPDPDSNFRLISY